MSEYSYAPPSRRTGGLSSPDTALLPPAALACLALDAPDAEEVGWLAGEMDNSLLLACLGGDQEAPATRTGPAAAPPAWGTEPWRSGKTRAGADPDRVTQASDEIARYEALLADDRAELGLQADADRAAGLPSRAVAQDDDQRALEESHARFASIPLADGVSVPAPYQVGFQNDEATRRATSTSRKATVAAAKDNVDPDALKAATSGKGDADGLGQLLQTLWDQDTAHTDLPAGEVRRRDARADRITPDGATPDDSRAADLLAFAQGAGFGVDCAGDVQHMLLNAGMLPEILRDRMTYVDGLTKAWGDPATPSKQTARGPVASPLAEDGSLGLAPGDMLRIDDDQHIGLVLQAVDQGDEIVVRYGHSTATQDVYSDRTQVGNRPEGVRDDIVTYDKATGEWRTVRGAYPSDRINRGRGDETPLFNGFHRLDDGGVQRAVDKQKSTGKP